MPAVYSTLSYSKKSIYDSLKSKLELLQPSCVFQNVSFDEIGEIFKYILEDHPEFFWLTGSGKGTIRTLGSQSTVEFRPEYSTSSTEQIRREKSALETKVTELIARAKRHSYNIYEQILYLHDYIVMSTDYRLNAPHCRDAYGCLVLGKAVCAGYAAAFHLLMNRLGVECGRVTGDSASALTGNVSHEWNYIRLSDGYYFVDVTWDDPIVSGGSDKNNLSHDFFCLDMNEIRLSHRFASNQFIPGSFGSRYNYYRYYGFYTERYSFDAVKTIAVKQLSQSRTFFVKFGSRTQLDIAVNDLVNNQRVYTIPGMTNRISYGKSKSGLILKFTAK